MIAVAGPLSKRILQTPTNASSWCDVDEGEDVTVIVVVNIEEFSTDIPGKSNQAYKRKRFRDIEPPSWRGKQWRQRKPMSRQRISHRQIGCRKKRF